MSKKKTSMVLLNRFRDESGDSEATRIRWNQLDRRDIPKKYKDIEINSKTMNFRVFYQNPEIVDNIHFFSVSNPTRYKRSNENDHECENIVKKPKTSTSET